MAKIRFGSDERPSFVAVSPGGCIATSPARIREDALVPACSEEQYINLLFDLDLQVLGFDQPPVRSWQLPIDTAGNQE
jgi:hypothetical protein